MDIHVNVHSVQTSVRISSPPTVIYLDIHTYIRADVHVELSVLQTVQSRNPPILGNLEKGLNKNAPEKGLETAEMPMKKSTVSVNYRKIMPRS